MSDNEYEESDIESEPESEPEMDEIPKKIKNAPGTEDNDDISVDDSDGEDVLEQGEEEDEYMNDEYEIISDDLFNDSSSKKKESQKSKLTIEPMLGDYNSGDDEDDEEEEDDEMNDPDYFKKFDENIKHNIISEYHPEMVQHNYQEVEILTNIVRNEQGAIVDPFHKTLPFLTKYEKARILGERAKQLNVGATPFVPVEPHMIDGYLIALKELEEKKIPFIIKRPLPNGGCEYWKLKDLEFIH
jgi:DNA-directed RNA polymerase I, II, and III subunit RPABC2